MAKQSSYTTVSEPVAGQFVPLILAPNTGPSGTGKTTIESFFGSQEFKNAALAYMNTVIVGEPSYLFVTPNVDGTIGVSVDPLFKNRVSTLEQMRALVQIKDALSSGAANYMSFPGTTGSYIDAPSVAGLNVTGDVGFAVRLRLPSSTPAANLAIFSRAGSTAATTQIIFYLMTTGQMQLGWSTAGVTINYGLTVAATPLAFDGSIIWIKATRQASTGQCDYFTAPDTGSNSVLPTTWTAFNLNRGSASGDLNATSGAPFEIAGYNAGASSMGITQVYRVIWYNNETLTGTPILDANASDYTSGTTWTGPSGNVFTLHGTASIAGGGGTAIANTTSEFSLGETDAYPTLAVANHDTLLWSTEATLVNTSGGAVNFTPKLKVGGVDLFTFAALSVPSAAASVYNLGCAVKLSINAVDGTTQIARAQLIVSNAVTGTDAGSIVMTSNLLNVSGNRTGAIATITTVPQMQLRMTMGTAASTISARPLRTELFLAKA